MLQSRRQAARGRIPDSKFTPRVKNLLWFICSLESLLALLSVLRLFRSAAQTSRAQV